MKKLAYTFILLTALMGTSVVTIANTPSTATQKTQEATTDANKTSTDKVAEKADAKETSTNKSDEKQKSNFKVVNTKVKTADEAIALLKQGNERFLKDQSEQINVSSERRTELKDGQNPYAVVISCSDSRVSPSHVFNAGLGEIFEIRVAGNVLDDMALGSVEYGAEHLGCPVIVVMGHECCGAVTATYDAVTKKQKVEGYIGSIVEEITPSVVATHASSIEDASHENVYHVIEQIKADKAIAPLIKEGKVKVVGAYYTLDGKVTFLDEKAPATK